MTTREEAIAIVNDEGLGKWARFGNPKNCMDCVAVWQEPDGWHVANTDERAVVCTNTQFSHEQEALSEFIQDLRLAKQLSQRFDRR